MDALPPISILLVLLGIILFTAAAVGWWTWWLCKDRQAPLQDSANTARQVAKATTELVHKLGDELARTHGNNAEIMAAFLGAFQNRETLLTTLPQPPSDNGTHERDQVIRETEEVIARRRALVDAAGEGFDDED